MANCQVLQEGEVSSDSCQVEQLGQEERGVALQHIHLLSIVTVQAFNGRHVHDEPGGQGLYQLAGGQGLGGLQLLD